MFLIYLLNRYVDFVLSPLKYQVWQTRFLGCGSCYIKIYIFLIPFQYNPSIPPYLSLNVNFSSTCLDFSCLLKWLHWPYQYNFLYQRFYIITCCLTDSCRGIQKSNKGIESNTCLIVQQVIAVAIPSILQKKQALNQSNQNLDEMENYKRLFIPLL